MTSTPSRAAARAPSARAMHDMTAGPVRAHVLRMMTFMLAGMTIQSLYTLVDIYWVGRLGKEAVAAVALSTNLVFASLAVTQMLSVGCVALVSQAAGRKDEADVQRLFNQSQSLSTVAGLVFLVVTLLARDRYVAALASDARTRAIATEFLGFFVPALALQFPMIGLGSALRGIGDMKPGLVAQTLSVVLNMVLAPALVFGWIGGRPLGAAGAALATLVVTLLAVAGLAVYVARGPSYLRFRFAALAPDLRVWRRMLAIGLPSGGEFFLLALTIGSIYAVTRPFGPEAQAGFGIGSRIMQAGFIPAVAIAFSAAAVVGQNVGAGAFDRVRETSREAAKLTILFMAIFTAICQVLAAPLVGVFSPAPDVIAAGVDYLKTTSLVYVANGLVFVGAGIFQGVGNTWPSLAASGLRAAVFLGPVWMISHRPGATMHTVWLVSIATTLFQLLVQRLLLRRELARLAARPPG